ncbi:cysteine--1-D-myo-inosityl 2-amino-2-deoxy-alpha-D-glucopyranoside ligase [Terracoccus luteus]|uniref:L-cysteine:1D-myo-inositol 2-amino-2-deoxy-alpha-D-glucopyranoside ligase n=1 Tax=Terracoccus luteus TaxID=53356 RepID=A0A839Q3F9_9MICO|nr:cysteine--1-D-myo-inosityl 2-amino-2-deoxy-alpha-D-glucopyranoside ligase [Terracoccus luteus]MBB2987672.1 L-cysteine:1D-myo-inositol 2-amino-2-deoxy-alpha-D-glucopyranoside ligase [Terracoccus luteus]MCP2173323.1 L-cysteine:1D-myo-inositol 2-amino-2-deoxy-alpha-D-glucopyranoside ligase [Terracoccus luteus]
MKSWPQPFVPELPGRSPQVMVHDTASGTLVPAVDDDRAERAGRSGRATLYVCGITPYDATHLGHAATYVTFDLLVRALRDSGHTVTYVQNITDVDDPLLERAERDGIDWRDLATREIDLFREDMTALAVIPPDAYLGAVESIPTFVEPVERLVEQGRAYRVPAPDAADEDAADVYFEVGLDPRFGSVSHLDEAGMLEVFAERGGDPDREGKRGRLDALLWRAHREGEPDWDGGSLGRGRPGWHIECACLALDHLGVPIDVQGGGSDLVFPHHEMSAGHGRALAGTDTFAGAFVHQGMVGLDGEKMSKSKGNLVLVSSLRRAGVDPMAIRLVLLAHHHRDDWIYDDDQLVAAQQRLDTWRKALSGNGGPVADQTVDDVRAALANDLDSPTALAAVDRWATQMLTRGGDDPGAPGVLGRALDALLGIRL